MKDYHVSGFLSMNKRPFIYSLPMILLLIIAVTGWFATDYLGNKARLEIVRESQASVLTLSTYVSSTVTTIEGSVKSLAGSPWIAPALLSKKDKDIEHANSALDRYNSALNASVSYLMDANGMTVASSNRKDPDSFVGKSYRFRPYFLEAAKGQPYHYFALGITSGKRGFYASYPVQNPLGKVIGVITMKKDLDDMGIFFRKYPFCFLISPEGIIFLSSKPEMDLKSFWPLDKTAQEKLIASRQFGNKLFETVTKKEIADGTEVTLEGKDYFVSRKIIDSDGWSIVLLNPTDRIWIYKLTGILATIFVCLLIMVFAGTIYLAERSQKAIRQSEESKSLLLHAAGEGIFGVDASGLVTFINPAALRMLGFAEEEMLGKRVHALIHHSHEDGSNYPVEDCPMYASYTKATESHMADEVLWRKDGSYFHVDYFSTSITKDGKVLGAVVTFRDITKRKKNDELIKILNEQQQLILDASPTMIFYKDKENRFIRVNESMARANGKSKEEMEGKTCWDIFPREAAESYWQDDKEVMTDGKPSLNIIEEMKTPQGTMWVQTDKIPYRNSKGEIVGIIGFTLDITERKRTDSYGEMSTEILQILSKPSSLHDSIQNVIAALKIRTGFDAVGIRLRDSDDFPYFAQNGFSNDFLLTENTLIERDANGRLCRDKDGNVNLECTCGLVISGKTDPSNPLFTRGGSFWTNDSLPLLDLPSDQDPRLHPRNTCMHQGYASVALVPIRTKDKIIGLMQFNDRRKNCFSLAAIEQIEGIAANIGEALLRKQAEEALQESEERYRILVENARDIIFRTDNTGHFTFANPVTLFITGYSEEEIIGKHYKMLVRPDKLKEVITLFASQYENRVQNTYHEFPIITKDGHEIWIGENTQLLVEDGHVSGFQAVARDITERRRMEGEIQYLATHDSLTGLPNRLMFSQILNHAIQTAKRYQRQFAVLFIDLDRFKIINDTMGHDAGDQLLQEIAARLKKILRTVDVVGRLGGDEFIILIEEVKELSQVVILADKILAGILKPITLMGKECRITASIGICMYPKDAEDEQSLMKNADIAMYLGKEEGKNNYQFYSKDIQSKSLERLSIETNLRFALERNELSLHYQAQVDFKTNVIKGVEALLRWQNPYLGSVTPTQFIPVAEESGLIIPIGRWVLKTACAQNVAWQKQGLPAVCMSVNLSRRQLMDDHLIDDIRTALNDSGMAPNLLELEITESMVMHNPALIISVLTKLKSMGVRLAIDDFGTGYSSLAQIKDFPIDTLKVDRSFIRNIPKDTEYRAITEAIIAMGKTLGLTVVAEGVETVEQMTFLKEHSCDEMQGYYFSKPIVPEQFADLLRKHVPSLPEWETVKSIVMNSADKPLH